MPLGIAMAVPAIILFLLLPSSAQRFEVTADVDIDILPFGLRITPVRVNGTARERVQDVFAQYGLMHVAVCNATHIVSNYSTYNFTMQTENTTHILNGVQVNRTRMFTTFPNNITASFIVERFAAPTFKNYFGWKMDLSSYGVKASLRFEGLTRNSELNNPSARLSAMPSLVARIHPFDDYWDTQFLLTGDPNMLPIIFFPNRRFDTALSPTPQDDPAPQFNFLRLRDKSVNLTISHLTGVSCITNNGSERFVEIGFALAWPTEQGQHGNQETAFASAVTQMRESTTRFGYAQFMFPAQVDMYRDRCSLATDVFEYDPDISILFGVDSEPPLAAAPQDAQLVQDDATAARLAGIITGCIIGAALVVLVVALIASPKLRQKLMPMSGFKESQIRVRSQIAEGQQRETHTFAPPESKPSSDTAENRRWTRASMPPE